MSTTDASDFEAAFSEREFYLAEFRRRTLAFALPKLEPGDVPLLEPVLAELQKNLTRVLLLSADRSMLEQLVGNEIVASAGPGWVGRLWRAARGGGRLGIHVPASEDLAATCRRVLLRLRVAKLLWLDPQGPLESADGSRISLLDLPGLDALLAAAPDEAVCRLSPERRGFLQEVRTMLAGGLPAVNLCSVGGLDDDLFTFEGSGTFFARERYLEVRHLALDEFDTAHALIRRGVAEGYLVERSAERLEEILETAFGVFVEGRYLAGVGALLLHVPEGGEQAGEISSLYTLTRFVGEGVGGHLVSFALETAETSGLAYVFACTTSERVEAFFVRHGFERVGPDRVPSAKWRDYPEERKARVLCLRRDLR